MHTEVIPWWVVQWLGLCILTAQGLGSISGPTRHSMAKKKKKNTKQEGDTKLHLFIENMIFHEENPRKNLWKISEFSNIIEYKVKHVKIN